MSIIYIKPMSHQYIILYTIYRYHGDPCHIAENNQLFHGHLFTFEVNKICRFYLLNT